MWEKFLTDFICTFLVSKPSIGVHVNQTSKTPSMFVFHKMFTYFFVSKLVVFRIMDNRSYTNEQVGTSLSNLSIFVYLLYPYSTSVYLSTPFITRICISYTHTNIAIFATSSGLFHQIESFLADAVRLVKEAGDMISEVTVIVIVIAFVIVIVISVIFTI